MKQHLLRISRVVRSVDSLKGRSEGRCFRSGGCQLRCSFKRKPSSPQPPSPLRENCSGWTLHRNSYFLYQMTHKLTDGQRVWQPTEYLQTSAQTGKSNPTRFCPPRLDLEKQTLKLERCPWGNWSYKCTEAKRVRHVQTRLLEPRNFFKLFIRTQGVLGKLKYYFKISFMTQHRITGDSPWWRNLHGFCP